MSNLSTARNHVDDFDVKLEFNGLSRAVVFPNAVRDVRRERGFDTLRDFDSKVAITYTRLAKIERGEIFPAVDELEGIASALNVKIDDLLIDTTDPRFDRDAWAHGHIEARLLYKGGDREAMAVGAAMRVVRREQLKLSTTDMGKFGLPAATVSRIENADRPLMRWDWQTREGIANVLNAGSPARILEVVDRMGEEGKLDATLTELFSPESLERRNNKRLRALLQFIPGETAAAILGRISPAFEDGDTMYSEEVANPFPDGMNVLSGSIENDGVFHVSPTDTKVDAPSGVSARAFALEVLAPVLGPGLPVGSVVIADPLSEIEANDVAVIVSQDGARMRLLSVTRTSTGLVGFSMTAEGMLDLSQLEAGAYVSRVVSTISRPL